VPEQLYPMGAHRDQLLDQRCSVYRATIQPGCY